MIHLKKVGNDYKNCRSLNGFHRLWKNDKWDKVPITIEIPEGLEESEEFIESKAVQQAWLNISMISIGSKPFQIGLYMQSLYGA